MERVISINEIVRHLHVQWEAVKEQAALECGRGGFHDTAEKYRACHMFKGTEDLPELISLLTSTQGAEFCIRYRFPSPAVLRLFKPFNPERYGFYIDAGEITLVNPGKAVLAGHTSATVNCDTLERHKVFLLHGAKAAVNASGWAVVSVTAMKGCQVIRNVEGNAIIL